MRDVEDRVCGFNPLNPEVKRDWLMALRGGEFTQTNSTLGDANGYCCLGVAAVTCLPADRTRKTADGNLFVAAYPKAFTDDSIGSAYSASLPEWACDVLGLDPDAQTRLIELNDQENKNFSEIAAWIEATL